MTRRQRININVGLACLLAVLLISLYTQAVAERMVNAPRGAKVGR